MEILPWILVNIIIILLIMKIFKLQSKIETNERMIQNKYLTSRKEMLDKIIQVLEQNKVQQIETQKLKEIANNHKKVIDHYGDNEYE